MGESQQEPAESSPRATPRGAGARTWRGTLVITVLAALLGLAVVTQVRQHEKSDLSNLSQSELVALLANVNDESSRLSDEQDTLRQSKTQLEHGDGKAAVADAQKRLDQLAVLNGTKPVSGPGITLAVTGAGKVTSANLLDAVEELRDAGAESIDIGGHRVVVTTWFGDGKGAPTVAGAQLPSQFTVTAIGDPHTMSTAMAIPGGVTDTLTQAGAHVKVTESKALHITSVRSSN